MNKNSFFSNEAIYKEGFYFDTYIKITIYDCKENSSSAKNFQNILDECMSMCAYYENIFSPTNENSELYKLNNDENYWSENNNTSPILTDIIDKTIETTIPFNQKFSTTWNEFTLDCVDQLGILEYIKFPPLLNDNYDYNTPLYFIQLCLIIWMRMIFLKQTILKKI